MTVEIQHIPDQSLVITRYLGTHTVADAETVVEALETQSELSACYRFLIDLAEVSDVEATPAKRGARIDRMLSAVKQSADKLILIAYYAPTGVGSNMAKSFQPQWNTQDSVISMASDSLADCAMFLDVPVEALKKPDTEIMMKPCSVATPARPSVCA